MSVGPEDGGEAKAPGLGFGRWCGSPGAKGLRLDDWMMDVFSAVYWNWASR